MPNEKIRFSVAKRDVSGDQKFVLILLGMILAYSYFIVSTVISLVKGG